MEEAAETDASYPPIFRRPNPDPNPGSKHDADQRPAPASPVFEVPVIDLEPLDPVRLEEVCRSVGLFRITNHGVPSALMDRLLDQARGLLSLPFESKQTLFSDRLSYIWGTPSLGAKVSNLNWVEGFHIPLGQLKSRAHDLDSQDSAASFRCSADEYGQHMARIARTLFNAAAARLELDAKKTASYLSEFDGTFVRVYRYPCCPDIDTYFGMGAHTDSSVLSILCQDELGGLQVFHDNQWFDVAPIPGTLIVNLGDMMQVYSNDEYKSVKHRVLANRSKERISVCYFAFPMEDSLIISSRYKAFTYREWKAKVLEDIKATGDKLGLVRFRIDDPS
ncbi:gibberellin 2-beta-dioxygenase 6 [Elaeis guineensis]|uniref:Gibberellin 2-beta-dioxygenase 6 n=1 Tax=Elaeis guineensis var. tenera TaxID=51953 RepID=A0A6I9R5P1_ELAGV|nr:gibberellin 2-beta-dioxygenase 6 [Elaeis guineensis]